jgi:AbrB family looped-hinge helix DNA binding protein
MLTTKTKVTDGGRIVIPAKMREELGIEIGQEVIVTLKKGAVEISTPNEALFRLQKTVKKFVPGKTSLADELIHDRRKESKND